MFMRAIPVLVVVFLVDCSNPEQMLVNPEITTSTLEDGAVGNPYNGRLRATGGTGPYTWSLESVPAELSSWLKVDPATGVLSGTPMAKVSPALPFIVRVTDSWSTPRTANRTLTLGVKGCDPGAQVSCYYATNGQCLQSTLVCSADGKTGTCGGGSHFSDMNHCGSGGGGTCGVCSSTAADNCSGDTCMCGTNPACSGSTATCCSSSCVDLQTDVNNCATCGDACTNTPGPNAHVVCSSGTCSTACDTDYMPCSSGCCSQAAAVSAGYVHSCALLKSGAVECWGGNDFGQLGNNTTTESHIPVAVRDSSGSASLTGVRATAASRADTCALISNGGVQCWGENASGELGNNTTTDSLVPVAVYDSSGSAPLTGVRGITAGYSHTCALTGNGVVQCWGDNSHGQLGTNSTSDSYVAVSVVNLASGVTTIAAKYYHTCAVTGGGGVQCWGYNDEGQLGNPTVTAAINPLPVYVVDSSGTGHLGSVAAVTTGTAHTCALTIGGNTQCWGYNYYGQLGNPTVTSRRSFVPVSVSSLSGVTAIAAGSNHTCAITNNGGVWCWGVNTYGQLGNPNITSQSSTPVQVITSTGTPLSGVSALTAGDWYTCALMNDGNVQCWGYNYHGQLGNNSTTGSHVPVAVDF